MSEKESYKSPELNSSENDEVEIDWWDICSKLIAARKALLWSVIIGVVLGIVIALSMPKEYTVAVTLSPEMGDESKSAGGLASLASSFLGGSTASGGSDALNVSLSSDIVASTPFVLGLFDVRVQTIDNSLDTTLVAYLDEQKSPWWSYILSSPGMVVGWVKSWFTKDSDDEVSTSVSRRPFQLTEKEAQKVATIKSMVAQQSIVRRRNYCVGYNARPSGGRYRCRLGRTKAANLFYKLSYRQSQGPMCFSV